MKRQKKTSSYLIDGVVDVEEPAIFSPVEGQRRVRAGGADEDEGLADGELLDHGSLSGDHGFLADDVAVF